MKSMSGYGCGEAQAAGWRIKVEVRSLNHRFLDVALRFPRFCLAWEEPIRSLVGERLRRGRVEVFLALEAQEDACRRVKVDKSLARAYHRALRELEEVLGLPAGADVVWLAQLPGVLQPEEAPGDPEGLWGAVRAALEQALAAVEEMREAEGARLAADLGERLRRMRELAEQAARRAPRAEAEYREKLAARLGELAPQLEPGRLAVEAAFHAEKASIHEELVRLGSHLAEMERLLGHPDPIGRRLDFLLQEAFREASTMAAKAQDAEISTLVVEMKAELEKMREQGQNVV